MQRVSFLTVSKLSVRGGGARGRGWYYRTVAKLEKENEIFAYDRVITSSKSETPKIRPQMYLDISIDTAPMGRLVMELASDVVPKTAKNFTNLCHNDMKNCFAGQGIHHLHTGHLLTAGKSQKQGGVSTITETPTFNDENFVLQFSERGVLGMTNGGVHKNAAQFFITMKPLPHLNGTNVREYLE